MHLCHEIQVTWHKQSYQNAIFNPENSQKVPKIVILAVSTFQCIIHVKLSIRMMIWTLSLNIWTWKSKNYSNLSNKAKNIQKVPNYSHFGGIFGNSFPLQFVCCLFCSLKWLIFTTIHYNCNRIVKYIKIRTLGSIYIIKTSNNYYIKPNCCSFYASYPQIFHLFI